MTLSLLVKQYILQICDGPVHVPEKLPDYVPLSHLGYDEDSSLCGILEDKLKQIIAQYNTGKHITHGYVSDQMTVSQCIDLVA